MIKKIISKTKKTVGGNLWIAPSGLIYQDGQVLVHYEKSFPIEKTYLLDMEMASMLSLGVRPKIDGDKFWFNTKTYVPLESMKVVGPEDPRVAEPEPFPDFADVAVAIEAKLLLDLAKIKGDDNFPNPLSDYIWSEDGCLISTDKKFIVSKRRSDIRDLGSEVLIEKSVVRDWISAKDDVVMIRVGWHNDKSQTSLKVGKTTIYQRHQPAFKKPQVEDILPKHEHQITFSVEAMDKVIKELKQLKMTTFKIEGGIVTGATAHKSSVRYEQILTHTFSDGVPPIAFAVKYIELLLQFWMEPVCKLVIEASDSGVLVDNGLTTILVMPMKWSRDDV